MWWDSTDENAPRRAGFRTVPRWGVPRAYHAGQDPIPMNVHLLDAIQGRRSIKEFTDRPVDTAALSELLETAVWAPNHRMTEPWGFVVLGPETRRAYGEVLGSRRAGSVEDPAAAETIRRTAVEQMVSLPAAVAFTQRLNNDPEIREEDFATVYMGMQNVLLAAAEMGLGTHVKTGAILDDPRTRAALQVAADERIVALLHIGEPASSPDPKPRASAAERTRWLP